MPGIHKVITCPHCGKQMRSDNFKRHSKIHSEAPKQDLLILVINLKRSPERLSAITKELDKHKLEWERIEAVDGRDLEIVGDRIPGFKKMGRCKEHSYRGSAGCLFSHQKALKRALELNQFPCIVLEDDVVIDSIAPPHLVDTNASLIYYGGLPVEGKGIYGGHAICYRTPEAAKLVLDLWAKKPDTLDSRLVTLQREKPELFHFIKPWTIRQRAGYSFILEKELPNER